LPDEVETAEQHVLALRGTPPAHWTTRDRILLEASRLFATHGFRGASTRQIAERVGVAQPSLFKHFRSKRAILAALAVYDMDVPARHAEQAARSEGSAVDRFAGYVAWDFEWYQAMPFDLRGMTEDVVTSEGLLDAQAALRRWHEAIDQLLQQGVAAGEFAASAVPFLPTVIETLSWHMVHAADASTTNVDDAVELVLAATLVSARDVGH
jgi:AcrR family transcriptional regulator